MRELVSVKISGGQIRNKPLYLWKRNI